MAMPRSRKLWNPIRLRPCLCAAWLRRLWRNVYIRNLPRASRSAVWGNKWHALNDPASLSRPHSMPRCNAPPIAEESRIGCESTVPAVVLCKRVMTPRECELAIVSESRRTGVQTSNGRGMRKIAYRLKCQRGAESRSRETSTLIRTTTSPKSSSLLLMDRAHTMTTQPLAPAHLPVDSYPLSQKDDKIRITDRYAR